MSVFTAQSVMYLNMMSTSKLYTFYALNTSEIRDALTQQKRKCRDIKKSVCTRKHTQLECWLEMFCLAIKSKFVVVVSEGRFGWLHCRTNRRAANTSGITNGRQRGQLPPSAADEGCRTASPVS